VEALSALRRWAWIEGTSLLVLVLVGMPLRHLAGIHCATQIVGTAHGIAFLFFINALTRATSEYDWPAKRWLVLLGIAFVPGGVFFFRRAIDSAESPQPH